MSHKKEWSKTFCVYPWIHQQTTPLGRVNFCCLSTKTWISDDRGQPIRLHQNTLQEAWNTQDMKEIRKKMIAGQKVKGCETCYKLEEIGKRSYRESHNKEWFDRIGKEALDQKIEKSIADHFHVSQDPVCLDLRLGQLCNLKCRSCSPQNSLPIFKEWEDLDKKSQGDYSKFWKPYSSGLESCEPWYEQAHFWESLEALIPSLEKVYMTGGEPTLIESNQKFLRKCVDLGYSKKIDLFFNTNMTVIGEEFVDLLNEFRAVGINASIDAYGDENNYIRYPSQWKNIDERLKMLMKRSKKHITLGFSPVIQVYNLLTFCDLLSYIEKISEEFNRKISVDFLFCFKPQFLDFIHLPSQAKEEALLRFKSYRDSSKMYRDSHELSFYLKNGLDSLIKRLETESGDPSFLRDMAVYTATLDKQRNQQFSLSFPLLNRFLEDEGVRISETSSIVDQKKKA